MALLAQDRYPILKTKGRVVLYKDNANGEYIKKLFADTELMVSKVEKSKNSNAYYAKVIMSYAKDKNWVGECEHGWVSLGSSNLELVDFMKTDDKDNDED
jgi:hypothetical protein